MDLFLSDFFTPATDSVLICPICGTISCIDREFRHGLIDVKRSVIFKLRSEIEQETVKTAVVDRNRRD